MQSDTHAFLRATNTSPSIGLTPRRLLCLLVWSPDYKSFNDAAKMRAELKRIAPDGVSCRRTRASTLGHPNPRAHAQRGG